MVGPRTRRAALAALAFVCCYAVAYLAALAFFQRSAPSFDELRLLVGPVQVMNEFWTARGSFVETVEVTAGGHRLVLEYPRACSGAVRGALSRGDVVLRVDDAARLYHLEHGGRVVVPYAELSVSWERTRAFEGATLICLFVAAVLGAWALRPDRSATEGPGAR